jgi:hypothetical protein
MAVNQGNEVRHSSGEGVRAYYDRNTAVEWERLERHRTEFAVTLRALRHNLPPPPAAILDVGGGPFTNAYFAHPDEISPFMEAAGFATLGLIGCEGIVAGHEEKINALQGEAWELWVDLNYRLGQDPALRGAADHLLYIGRSSI